MARNWVNTIERLFNRYVTKTDSCWIWTGLISPQGYGRTCVNYKNHQAHRVIYEALIDKVPDGMVLDHLCRNRSCVNPEHLEVVTQRTNILRGVGMSAKNIKKTHCSNGHEFSGYNLSLYGNDRRCKTCAREAMWRMRLRRKQTA